MPKSFDDLARLLAERHDATAPACLVLSEEDAIALYQRGHLLDRGDPYRADPIYKVRSMSILGLPILLDAPPKAFHKDFPWALRTP